VMMRCRAWDLAASTGDKADWTVGVRVSKGTDGIFYIEHVYRQRLTPKGVQASIKSFGDTDPAGTLIRLPIDPAAGGQSWADVLVTSLAGYPVKAERVKASKEIRATVPASQAQANNVRLVKGPWNELFLDELCVFPAGRHDDQVDAFSDALTECALTHLPMFARQTRKRR
jgi:predicted phage terminase large subunit-like protein